ncbi:MAG: response regulator [Gammaproteobacteria bacterium]|nr:response regulator [Gammaproteobacteria bacterium]MDH5800712.1 response regulator [Gammaproteobacteria bacterium]
MGKRILIVEDSTMMRRVITKTLEEAGHQVVGEASSGDEAIQKYGDLLPDLVTMDITMRGMDGITAAKEILSRDKNAKILILSNMDEDKYRGEVERIGAIGLVNKHKSEKILKLIEG